MHEAKRNKRAEEELRLERRIVEMVMDEYDRLASLESGEGEASDLLEKATHNVVRESYPDPPDYAGFYNHDLIAESWLKTMRSWPRIEWIWKASRERPDVPKKPPGRLKETKGGTGAWRASRQTREDGF